MYGFLDRAFNTLVTQGTLRVTDPGGIVHEYGDGSGVPVNLHIKTPLAAAKVAADADLYFGELYMDGSLDVSGGTTIYDIIALLMESTPTHRLPKVAKAAYAVRKALKRVDSLCTVTTGEANVYAPGAHVLRNPP